MGLKGVTCPDLKMETIGALSYIALLWSVLCSAQQSTSIVATLQIADQVWSSAPYPTTFEGHVSTSMKDSTIVTAYTIPCADFAYCTSDKYLEFTVTTRSTTHNLEDK